MNFEEASFFEYDDFDLIGSAPVSSYLILLFIGPGFERTLLS